MMREYTYHQILFVLHRVKYGETPLVRAANEISNIIDAPDIEETELTNYLQTVSAHHRAGTIKVHREGHWIGLPTGKGIQDVLNISKSRIPLVRDSWYRLVAGMPPYHPEGPVDIEFDVDETTSVET